MKTPFYREPRFAKWSMFTALVLAMGANLSLNPQTLNISRHGPLKFDVASTEQPAAEAATAQKLEVGTAKKYQVSDKLYTVKVSSLDEEKIEVLGKPDANYVKTTIKVQVTPDKAITVAQGSDCSECNSPRDITLILTQKNQDMATELKAAIEREYKAVEAKPETRRGSAERGKKETEQSKITAEIDRLIAQKTEECKKFESKRDLFDCHAGNLEELSKEFSESEFADSNQIRTKLFKYYRANLHKYFSSAFAQNSESSSVFSRRLRDDSDKNIDMDQANELAGNLLENLQAENAQDIVADLMRTMASSFSMKAQRAYQLSRSNNPRMASFGMNQMVQLRPLLETTNFNTLATLTANDSFDQMMSLGMVQQNLYEPVDQMLAQITAKMSGSSRNGNMNMNGRNMNPNQFGQQNPNSVNQFGQPILQNSFPNQQVGMNNQLYPQNSFQNQQYGTYNQFNPNVMSPSPYSMNNQTFRLPDLNQNDFAINFQGSSMQGLNNNSNMFMDRPTTASSYLRGGQAAIGINNNVMPWDLSGQQSLNNGAVIGPTPSSSARSRSGRQ